MSPLILIKFSCFLPLPSHISWHVQVIILLIGSIQLPIIIISCLMILKTNFLTFIFSIFWKRKWNWIQIWRFCAKKISNWSTFGSWWIAKFILLFQIQIVLAQNHSVTKTELKKKFSQIGPAIPELWGNLHTDITYIQTDKDPTTLE